MLVDRNRNLKGKIVEGYSFKEDEVWRGVHGGTDLKEAMDTLEKFCLLQSSFLVTTMKVGVRTRTISDDVWISVSMVC